MENTKPDMPTQSGCGYKCGETPSCAPLATSWVPMQQENPPTYGRGEALTRGTLFPGLDLPFKNIVNRTHPNAGTPLGELMAIWFAIKEMQLYLDTHPGDQDVFKALKETIVLEQEGRRRYIEANGPIVFEDLEHSEEYNWLSDPWPWDYVERTGVD